MKEREILYFHFILAFFCIIIGFYANEFINGTVNDNFTPNLVNMNDNPGILFFFKNNIMFFLIISIIPLINLYFFSVQFLSIGYSINNIINLSLSLQINILYRHLIFEIIAILLSILISYRYILVGRRLLKDIKINWKKEVKIMGILYLLIFIFTLIGAVLEGTSYVVS